MPMFFSKIGRLSLVGGLAVTLLAWGAVEVWAQRGAEGRAPAASTSRATTSALLLTVEHSALPPPTPPPRGARISFADMEDDTPSSSEQYTVRYFTTPAAATLPLLLVFDYRTVSLPMVNHSTAMRLPTTPAGYHAMDIPIPRAYSPVLHWRATLASRGRVLQRIESVDWPQ